jgi:hypothetical protein
MVKIWSKNIQVTQSCIKNIDFAGGVNELLLATVINKKQKPKNPKKLIIIRSRENRNGF